MKPSFSLTAPSPTPSLLFPPPNLRSLRFKYSSPPHRTHRFPTHSLPSNSNNSSPPPLRANQTLPTPQQPLQQPPRTVFPGGYKRPELKLPTIVLRVDPDDLLSREDGEEALDLVDGAVAGSAGIVVLDGSGAGKRLYEAACLLKSVVKDRAFLLVSERVDIASAVNASGVVLSDQGLPAVVARNMMISSNPDSVLLPLVGRNVQTPNAASSATTTEGADFLIYSGEGEEHFDVEVFSGLKNVKIPTFVVYASHGESMADMEASKILESGASGLVISLGDLKVFKDDALSQLLDGKESQDQIESINKLEQLAVENDIRGKSKVAGFVRVEDREKELIKREKSVLREAVNLIQKATPMMEEISLLIDAVAQIDEPFSLAIVGEFNSGKSTVINALLGKRYLNEGVVPTTNEITFLRYSKYDAEEEQRCERHPDGQYICYLPAPILEEMNIVDTPGTNVILQRQQRLTEEFVPRADLLLFVISADRPLTESEVTFLRYTQQWKKKVVFVLNKCDLYRNASELEEAISFIKENTRKLLNTENVTLYPVSARSALEAKLSTSSEVEKDYKESLVSESHWKLSRFHEFEKFLYSFLDGSTNTGMERMKLKLETPIAIAERLLSASETLVKQDCQYAKQDLNTASKIIDSVKDYAMKMENESITWRRNTISLIDETRSRILELVESTLQLSNIDLVVSYIFKAEKSANMPATMRIQNDIIGPALSDVQKLLKDYTLWLQSNNTREGKLYNESFERMLPSIIIPNSQFHSETSALAREAEISLRVIENFSAGAASKLFEQEIREVFVGTFGGLGAAGFSASLLTSVLPTTLEDLLALGLCSAGGFIAISTFPARRRAMVEKVNRIADGFAREVEEAMQKDLLETVERMEKFVNTIGRPYQDAAQKRIDKLLDLQDQLSNAEKELRILRAEIQNLHVS
ncbi:hypothetical protein Tsubulata_045568 [Turnera subulata]|uniref:G domain-containing protein n=1 Tax=Turnera subulata TaxID=218843 RepID=A0A9Q0G668_9ROSI|nr:hypothetical protein Tsubulata_045568 [Turnera subulata]